MASLPTAQEPVTSAALADVATTRVPAAGEAPAARAAAAEAFATDLFAGVHREGMAGRVLLVTGTADVARRRHEVAAVCELGRELIGA